MTPHHQHWLDSLSAIIPCLSLLISDMGNWKLEIVRKYFHRWRADREENRFLELFIDRHGVLREFSVDGHVPFQSARIIQRSSDRSSQTISSTTESRTGKELSHTRFIFPNRNFFFSLFLPGWTDSTVEGTRTTSTREWSPRANESVSK